MNVLPDHLSRLFPQETRTSYDDEKESFLNAYMQYIHDVQDDDECTSNTNTIHSILLKRSA
jgi:hypothetical protein